MGRPKIIRPIIKCKMCDNTFEFTTNKIRTKQYCSKKCSNSDLEVKQKIREGQQKIWDIKYNGQSPNTIPEIKAKQRASIKEKYGVEYLMQNQDIVNKATNTKRDKYGPKLEICTLKRINTNLKRYGVEYAIKNYNKIRNIKYDIIKNSWKHIEPLFTSEEYTGVTKNQLYKFKCNECEYIFSCNLNNGYIPRCKMCSLKMRNSNTTSKGELEILEYINSIYNGPILTNSRHILEGNELDIYLPDLNLAIEYNGIYWHSESKGKPKNYHLNKTEQCNDKGIQLIHIYDYQWHQKQEIIKSLIASKLNHNIRIFARKCNIRIVKPKIKNEFLNETHLHGQSNSSINLGLYYNDELLSVMTFGKPRYDKNYDYELIRFACKLNYNVIGGFSKLLKYFITQYSPKNILTYCDRNISNGNVYNVNNFTFISKSLPGYFYFKDYNIYSREQFKKHELKNKLKYFDKNLTEYENMKMNGYDRVWNSGNLKYELVY